MRAGAIWSLVVLLFLGLDVPVARAQQEPPVLQILEADGRHVLLELTLPAFESETVTHDGVAYQRLRVTGWGNWGQPGQPQLPMYVVPLGMPWPGKPRVTVVADDVPSEWRYPEAESRIVQGDWLYPVPALRLGESDAGPQVVETFAFDADAYAADVYYPGSLTEAASVGYLRDQPIFQLRLYPFQYNPGRQELRVYQRLKVLVTFPEAPYTLAGAERLRSPSAFDRMLARTLLNYDTLPSPVARSGGARVVPFDVLASGPRVKLRVEDSGLYRVTYDDLLAVAPDLVQGDPRQLELSNRASPVPILFSGEADGTFDPGDSFLFYGQAIDSDYTRYNVYWLGDDGAPGLRMAQRDGTPGAGSTPVAFGDSRHYEQDDVHWRAVPNGEGKDHWFWDDLEVSGSTPTSASYTFDLHHVAASGPDGELRLMLHGATYGDHVTQLYLNGSALLSGAERVWHGQTEKLYEVSVPQSAFVEGTNRLRVENLLPAGESSSEVYVNWFEITYQDTYVAEDDRLTFSAPAAGSYAFVVTGFTTDAIALFDVTDPVAPLQIVNHVAEPDGAHYRLRFNDSASADRRYLAQRSDGLPTPDVELDEPSAWKSAANGATYVIITHPSFYDAVQSLAAYRSTQGETVAVVETVDVYDEFNDGIYDAQAIRSFLTYAYANWSPRPVYVVLVGDASLDPKNNLGDSLPDLLPAYYVDTLLFGQTPDDAWYAKVHGDDDYPDLIVGRIPARTASQVATVVGKVQTYEQSPPSGDWVGRAVLVADDGDPNFARDMDTIAGLLPGSVTPIQMVEYDPGTSVQSEVSTGALVFAYSGHGSAAGTAWGTWSGGHRIFNQSQMQGLWNGDKLPFMTVANCLSGLFDHYDRARAMAEEFLLLDGKGGIASWAPASYGFPSANSLILEELYQAILVDQDRLLGSAATPARVQAHLGRPDLPLSLFEMYTYFGDPAVRLNLPPVLGPVASFVSSSPDKLGQTTVFQSTSTGIDLTHRWDFGDGGLSSTEHPTHTYAVLGSYTVTLTVSNTIGSSTAFGTVEILEDVHPPHAGFTSSSPDELGQTTAFTNTSQDGGDEADNVSCVWHFGDGTGSTARHPTHTYGAPGTYVVALTITNTVGSDAFSDTVVITEPDPAPGGLNQFLFLPLVLRTG